MKEGESKMSVKRRILIFFLIYIFNLMFFLLCLAIDRKGLFSTLRYDVGMVGIISILLLNPSFSEMCMVIQRYYCKKFCGSDGIALNMRCKLQKIVYPFFYFSLLVMGFCDTKLGLLFYMVGILIFITLFCGGTGKFLWIAGDKKYYMNECGEMYLVNEVETNGTESVLIYTDYREKECKVRIRRKITW